MAGRLPRLRFIWARALGPAKKKLALLVKTGPARKKAVFKAQQEAYQEWIQENPSMAQSIEAGALGVSPQAVLDNTITAGGATGSSRAPRPIGTVR